MKDNTREGINELVARFGSRFTYKEGHELHGDFIYPYPVPMVQAWLLEEIPKAIHQELQKARQDWLREEIVKLEGMKKFNSDGSLSPFGQERYRGHNDALKTIIDRYHSELDQEVNR